MIANAKPEKVAKHAHLVVRGTVDHATRTVRVLTVYGGATAPDRLTVENLAKFGKAGRPWDAEEERAKLEGNWPDHAVLFLAAIDDRYWLVDTSSPSWVPAHAAVKYVRADGKLLGYHQSINPGPLNLVTEDSTLADLEAGIERWLKERPAAPSPRAALAGKERAAFWDLVTPWIDFYTRKVARSPRPGREMTETVAAFAGFATDHGGEARNRGVEALLILGKKRGDFAPERRKAVEAALAKLATALPRKELETVLLAELASEDVFAERELAGRTLLRMGPESARAGRDVLLKLLAKSEGTLETRAYWTLKYMGFDDAAEKALEEKEGRQGK